MKYDITMKQLVFFKEHGILTFDEFLDDTTHKSLHAFNEGDHPSKENEKCKKFACSRDVGELIHIITEKKPIRFLFDTLVGEGDYPLHQVNIQNILLIIRIPLNSNEVNFLKLEDTIRIDTPSWLLIYGSIDSVYVYGKEDQVSWLKRMGYSYGDRLKTEDFPLIYS